MMTGALAADLNVQALLRTTRLSSKSKSRLAMFFAKTETDNWASRLLAGKMGTLGAVVRGEVEKLQLPFDIGTEGVQDLIESNRDRLAQSQAHVPYEWRQLSDLPQIKSEEESQKPLFEGMELGRRSRVGSESNRPLPKGVKRKRFTQDGTPERYTETGDPQEESEDYVITPKQFGDSPWNKHGQHTFSVGDANYLTEVEPSDFDVYDDADHLGPSKSIAFAQMSPNGPRTDITGAGSAPHVFSHMTGLVADAIKRFSPRSLTFAAKEPSRIKLYRAMLQRLSNQAPDYLPHEISAPHLSDQKYFALVHKDHLPNMARHARLHGTSLTPLETSKENYAAKYGFEDLHPRAEDNKRFIDKHKSVTLAQTLRHPATSGEKNHYKKYTDFVKVGGTKPLPFKAWLEFHRTAKYHKAQKEREDAAKSEQLIGGNNRPESTFDPNELEKVEADNAASDESETLDQDQGTDEDSDQERSQDSAEGEFTRPSRSDGNPSKHSLNAIRDFAFAAYTSYYQDQDK